ncbi:MAG: hypothetical protein IJ087_21890 [Eggerthellaceae bacterium]|nr:hypothetical protein [Eggerthellaceae bacterium]
MTFGFFTLKTLNMVAVRRDLFTWKTVDAFTFQMKRLRYGNAFGTFTFPWKTRRGLFFRMQWLRRGVTFHIFTFNTFQI